MVNSQLAPPPSIILWGLEHFILLLYPFARAKSCSQYIFPKSSPLNSFHTCANVQYLVTSFFNLKVSIYCLYSLAETLYILNSRNMLYTSIMIWKKASFAREGFQFQWANVHIILGFLDIVFAVSTFLIEFHGVGEFPSSISNLHGRGIITTF